MATPSLNEQDWAMRRFVYQYLLDHGQPPTYLQAAQHFGVPAAEAGAAFRRLHDRHALFLAPGTDTVRIANPLSAVPTEYVVHADGRRVFANCALDALGVPAMLHADARIEGTYAQTGTPARFAVAGGMLTGDDGIVHFPLPFRHWYDDLIHT